MADTTLNLDQVLKQIIRLYCNGDEFASAYAPQSRVKIQPFEKIVNMRGGVPLGEPICNPDYDILFTKEDPYDNVMYIITKIQLRGTRKQDDRFIRLATAYAFAYACTCVIGDNTKTLNINLPKVDISALTVDRNGNVVKNTNWHNKMEVRSGDKLMNMCINVQQPIYENVILSRKIISKQQWEKMVENLKKTMDEPVKLIEFRRDLNFKCLPSQVPTSDLLRKMLNDIRVSGKKLEISDNSFLHKALRSAYLRDGIYPGPKGALVFVDSSYRTNYINWSGILDTPYQQDVEWLTALHLLGAKSPGVEVKYEDDSDSPEYNIFDSTPTSAVHPAAVHPTAYAKTQPMSDQRLAELSKLNTGAARRRTAVRAKKLEMAAATENALPVSHFLIDKYTVYSNSGQQQPNMYVVFKNFASIVTSSQPISNGDKIEIEVATILTLPDPEATVVELVDTCNRTHKIKVPSPFSKFAYVYTTYHNGELTSLSSCNPCLAKKLDFNDYDSNSLSDIFTACGLDKEQQSTSKTLSDYNDLYKTYDIINHCTFSRLLTLGILIIPYIRFNNQATKVEFFKNCCLNFALRLPLPDDGLIKNVKYRTETYLYFDSTVVYSDIESTLMSALFLPEFRESICILQEYCAKRSTLSLVNDVVTIICSVLAYILKPKSNPLACTDRNFLHLFSKLDSLLKTHVGNQMGEHPIYTLFGMRIRSIENLTLDGDLTSVPNELVTNWDDVKLAGIFKDFPRRVCRVNVLSSKEKYYGTIGSF